jgi:membrane-bound serine protease (ClpP class)
MRCMVYISLAAVILLSLPGIIAAGQDEMVLIQISDAITPAISDFIVNSIDQASMEEAAGIIIQLDTPGGLAESMREIVMAILGCKVPVIVHVAPSGARAASAGVMITIASDIAAMAPGTNIGAAHPVNVGSQSMDVKMSEKVINDMVAHAKSVAEERGRNVQWVEKAIRESISATESEALEAGVIDLVAKDLDDLLKQINGRTVKDKGTLHLENVKIKRIEENLRTKILKVISNPNIAYILMMIGLAGLYFELAHPGAIFPGVVGSIAIVLAFFSFQTLPVNYAGILLIILSVVFFILEVKITSYGMLSVAGIITLVLGSLMLYDKAQTGMSVSLKILLPTILLISGFFIVVAGLVVKTFRSKARTGAEGLVGEIGLVKKSISPNGKVLVHGELWNAVSDVPIHEGEKVEVVSLEDLILKVKPVQH